MDESLQNVKDLLSKDQSLHPSPRKSFGLASQRSGDVVVGANSGSAAARASSTGEPKTGCLLRPFKEVKVGLFENKVLQSLFFSEEMKKEG